MIGKFDKKRKEQKKILKELESIKSLLDDGELINDDYSSLAETAIRKSAHDALPAHNDTALQQAELAHSDSSDDDILIDDDPDADFADQHSAIADTADIPVLQEMVVDEAPQTTLAPGVLPGQQSLFEENTPDKTDAKAASTEAAQPVAKATSDALETPKPKAKPKPAPKPKTTENPFLPKHIKDRLNGTVDVPAYAQPNETVRSPYVSPTFKPAAKTESPAQLSTSLNNLEQQEIIDALINEFMPQIESKLRLRLSQILSKPSTK